MAIVDIKVPQMGEGLTEVRLLEFMKAPGDAVARDEVIYTMETDKATLEVESAEAGTLSEWLATEGDVLPIGATVARIDQNGSTARAAPRTHEIPVEPVGQPAVSSGRVIPPRTRAYAKELGLSDEILAQIPSATSKLMPSDIDAYKAGVRKKQAPASATGEVAAPAYEDHPLPDRQRKLNFHLKRSQQLVVPGSVSRPLPWEKVRDMADRKLARGRSVRPTEFQTLAYCVVRATKSCPKFRSALVREDTVRHYDHLQLGVAVALRDGDLTTAVVPDADLLSFEEFVKVLHTQVQSARAGNDQADAQVQLLLTYLGSHGVRDAIPVLVAPAIAVMFVGESYQVNGDLYSNATLTFDHKLMNGVEAAKLLSAIAAEISQLNPTE